MCQQLGIKGSHLHRQNGDSGVELWDAQISPCEVSKGHNKRNVLAVVVEVNMYDFARTFLDGNSEKHSTKVQVSGETRTWVQHQEIEDQLVDLIISHVSCTFYFSKYYIIFTDPISYMKWTL